MAVPTVYAAMRSKAKLLGGDRVDRRGDDDELQSRPARPGASSRAQHDPETLGGGSRASTARSATAKGGVRPARGAAGADSEATEYARRARPPAVHKRSAARGGVSIAAAVSSPAGLCARPRTHWRSRANEPTSRSCVTAMVAEAYERWVGEQLMIPFCRRRSDRVSHGSRSGLEIENTPGAGAGGGRDQRRRREHRRGHVRRARRGRPSSTFSCRTPRPLGLAGNFPSCGHARTRGGRG